MVSMLLPHVVAEEGRGGDLIAYTEIPVFEFTANFYNFAGEFAPKDSFRRRHERAFEGSVDVCTADTATRTGILLSANSGLLICSLLRGFPGPLKTASLNLLLRKHMGLIVFPQRH